MTTVGQISGDARIGLDAGGNLVTAAFVNPHLHLDKVYTLEMLDEQALLAYPAARHPGRSGGGDPGPRP